MNSIKFYLIILYQLQNLIVTLHVIGQFEHFWHQMKGENLRIQMMELMLKKITMMKFYMQIEWTYEYGTNIIYFDIYVVLSLILLMLLLVHNIPITKFNCNFGSNGSNLTFLVSN